jgi:hypothetical protein
METITRTKVIEILECDWAPLVQRYYSLSSDNRKEYLERQGYDRFADLLAHIIEWWEEGKRNIENHIKDPSFQPKECDVDVVNAKAIEEAQGISEEAIIQLYETTIEKLIEFIENLPKSAFTNEKIVKQFDMEFISHLQDHKI